MPQSPTIAASPEMGDSVHRLVRDLFVCRMEAELQANQHKGDWRQWKPSPLGVLAELQHHEAKLMQALATGDCQNVREFAADIANIAMKIDEQFGGPPEQMVTVSIGMKGSELRYTWTRHGWGIAGEMGGDLDMSPLPVLRSEATRLIDACDWQEDSVVTDIPNKLLSDP